ncbi:hypothetical protein, partial [Metamycoplasma hyosynoviae]
SVKQEQMNNWINSNNPEDWAKVELDFYGLITISIKGYTSKPDRWSPYWAGQYWKQNQQGGVSEKGFKILWNQN